MQDVELSFHGMFTSAALERLIREKLARLDRYLGSHVHRRIVVVAPHHHPYQGDLYTVQVDLMSSDRLISGYGGVDRHYVNDDAQLAVEAACEHAVYQIENQLRGSWGRVRPSRRRTKGSSVLHAAER
jgi:hypothetical protein